MKKTYKSPQFMVVRFSAKDAMLTISVSETEIAGGDAGLVKEQSGSSWPTGSKSIWDDEW